MTRILNPKCYPTRQDPTLGRVVEGYETHDTAPKAIFHHHEEDGDMAALRWGAQRQRLHTDNATYLRRVGMVAAVVAVGIAAALMIIALFPDSEPSRADMINNPESQVRVHTPNLSGCCC